MNKLYYGDNLEIMREYMNADSVDLIYLDPPFKSNKDYNLLYSMITGRPVPEQAKAFVDTWEGTFDTEKQQASEAIKGLILKEGIDPIYVQFWENWVYALRKTQPQLLNYLVYMVERLLWMKPILKETGSIYLHCDPAASHYIKVMMDGIFGHQNFRNEIIWRRTGAHGRARRWGPIHDTILFYTMSDSYTWNRTFEKYDPGYVEDFYRLNDTHGRYRLVTLDGPGPRTGSSGSPWRGVDPTKKGRHWEVPPDRALPEWFKHPSGYKDMTVQERLEVLDGQGLIYWPKRGSVPQYKRYLHVAEGNPVQDIIYDIRPVGSQAKQRMGFPTQKPVALLERIIQCSSNKGDVVFDPFCGCGTTIYAALKTGRNWIGCDVAIYPINLIRRELRETHGINEGTDYVVEGIPASVEAAEELFSKKRHRFQQWLVERVDGFNSSKKTGDRGIDGYIWFDTDTGEREMILQVKGGHLKIDDLRALRHVMEREERAELACLLCLEKPSKGMLKEAAEVGDYIYKDTRYPRLQILTVREILEEGREPRLPNKIGARKQTGQHALPF